MIDVEKVSFSYRSGFFLKPVPVLKDVSFQVESGTLFGLLGENGAGKSSLIHLMVGLRKPGSGDIRIFGASSSGFLAKKKIGFLPERPFFYSHLRGLEFLTHMGRLSGLSEETIRSQSEWALEVVGMKQAAKTRLLEYSKGMLQRIGIAQAILHHPEVLILDEPMSGLDPVGRKEIRDLMLEISSMKKTILFSTHIISDVEAMCQKIAVLKKGQLIGFGNIESFLEGPGKGFEIGFKLQKVGKAGSLPKARPHPLGYVLECENGEALNVSLGELLGKSAEILWVKPKRVSLEDLFESRRVLKG